MTVAYWEQRERNPAFTARPPDPGLNDYLTSSARQALYHSPFWAIYRFGEQAYSRWGSEDDNPTLSPEQATERYGLNGALTFDKEIKNDEAFLLYQRKLDETEHELILGVGGRTAGRKISGLGVSLAATAVDPINLASMFVPVVNETRFARMITANGGSLWKARAIRGAIEGSVGALMVEPFILLPALQEQSNYDYMDSAINMGFGTILGGMMQVGVGKLGDTIRVKKIRNSVAVEGFHAATRHLKNLSPEEADIILSAALADFMDDAPISAPAELAPVADKIVVEEIKWDHAEAKKQAIAELGFDTTAEKTYNVDKKMHDPQPNEPWYHGGLTIDSRGSMIISDDAFFFARDQHAAANFGGTHKNIFVANLDIKNPISHRKIYAIAQELGIADQGVVKTGPHGKMVNTNNPHWPQDFVHFKKMRDHLDKLGYDAIMDPREGHQIVIWDTKKIKTPGRKQQRVKIKGGAKFQPEPDTFKMYPKQKIADPKPFEKFYHARSTEDLLEFKKGKLAFFTRSDDLAHSVAFQKGIYEFSKTAQPDPNAGPGTFIPDTQSPEAVQFAAKRAKQVSANLKMENPASVKDVYKIVRDLAENMGEDELIDDILAAIPLENREILGTMSLENDLSLDDLFGRIIPEDLLYSDTVRKAVQQSGFDSFFGPGGFLDSGFGDMAGGGTAVIFDPKQIRVFGDDMDLMFQGIKFGDKAELKASLIERTEALKKSRIDNLVRKKHRAFKKKLAEQQAKIDFQNQDPMAFDSPDVEVGIKALEAESALLAKDLGVDMEGKLGLEFDPEGKSPAEQLLGENLQEFTPEEVAMLNNDLMDVVDIENETKMIEVAINCMIGKI